MGLWNPLQIEPFSVSVICEIEVAEGCPFDGSLKVGTVKNGSTWIICEDKFSENWATWRRM